MITTEQVQSILGALSPINIEILNGSGIKSTTSILIWIWCAFTAFGAINLLRSMRRYRRPQTIFLILISIGALPALATFSLFPLTYTLMSVPRQQVFELAYWQQELATGTFALRITSLLLTYQLVGAIVRFIPLRRELINAREARGLNHDDVANFTVSVTAEERHLWQRNDLVSLSFFQFSFYLIALALLWGCTIAGFHTFLTALASWALLFIVDDWSVIADYCYQFNSLPLAAHAVKVLTIDLILLITVPVALYPAQLGVIWTTVSLALLVSGLLVALYFWRARHFGVQDA